MTKNIDDIHCYDTRFLRALNNIETFETTERNRELLKKFVRKCRREEMAKSTITNYLNLIFRMIPRLWQIGYRGNLDELDSDTFDDLLIHISDVLGLSAGEVRNYKKTTKKFFGTVMDEDEIPKWVQKMTLNSIETRVQPSDIHTPEEIQKLLDACRHPRNKAMIAVLFDGGIRVGALASARMKNVVFHEMGATIYISKTSRCKKTAKAKGIPLTWSSGYLTQWLHVHPFKNDPEAPLWVSLNKKKEPLSYRAISTTLKSIGESAGINKPMNPHALRHTAITSWILDGLSEQEIKHRATWERGSTQMLNIYGNFTDQEINNSIYEKYGLQKENQNYVKLEMCPRCNTILKPSDKFCSRCGLVLSCGTYEKVQNEKDKTLELLNFLESEVGQQALEKFCDMRRN